MDSFIRNLALVVTVVAGLFTIRMQVSIISDLDQPGMAGRFDHQAGAAAQVRRPRLRAVAEAPRAEHMTRTSSRESRLSLDVEHQEFLDRLRRAHAVDVAMLEAAESPPEPLPLPVSAGTGRELKQSR